MQAMTEYGIRVNENDFRELLNELKHHRERLIELLMKNTELVFKARAAGSLAENVRAFMVLCDQYRNDQPTSEIPDGVRRLRILLILEETIETVVAMAPSLKPKIEALYREMRLIVENAPLLCTANLPDVADGLGDLDYVVEGARIAFGINGRPIAEAIHEANMTKAAGPIDPNTGKKLKPPGFVPPDVAKLLVEQGWTPPKS